MDEQKYIFIDKSGTCFESYQVIPDHRGEPDEYKDRVGAMMRAGCEFTVGDMMAFKQDLLDAGFEWGTDFYVRKC